jgi:hypothetical protein
MSKADAFAELQGLVDNGVIKFEGVSNEEHVNLDGLDPFTGQPQAGNVAGVIRLIPLRRWSGHARTAVDDEWRREALRMDRHRRPDSRNAKNTL